MRRTPTGQRPQISTRDSTGWSWPRLRPIHEQQARASHECQSSVHSSKNLPEQEKAQPKLPISNMADGRPSMEKARTQSVTDTGDAIKSEAAAVTRTTSGDDSGPTGNDPPVSEKTLPSETEGKPSSISFKNVSANETAEETKQPVTESHNRRSSVSEENGTHLPGSFADEDTVNYTEGASERKGETAVEQPEANASSSSESSSHTTAMRRSETENNSISHNETHTPVNNVSNNTNEPGSEPASTGASNSSIPDPDPDVGTLLR